jgi:hypothetical protein
LCWFEEDAEVAWFGVVGTNEETKDGPGEVCSPVCGEGSTEKSAQPDNIIVPTNHTLPNTSVRRSKPTPATNFIKITIISSNFYYIILYIESGKKPVDWRGTRAPPLFLST